MPTSAVCIGQNLAVNGSGQLQMGPCSVPKLIHDVMVPSGADGVLGQTVYSPGKKLMDQKLAWTNNTQVNYTILIRVTRRWKQWVVSNPNAVEFNDRWNWALNTQPDEPLTSGLYNGLCGSAIDLGTNTIAQPNSGVAYHWWGTTSSEEWVWEPIKVGDTFKFWYEAFVWTPPPWSDNANLNNPTFIANAGWSRIQLLGLPNKGALVTG